MSIKKHIPNALTCCNLISGCIGVVAAFNGNLILVPYMVWLAAIFDFFDGFAARLLKVSSPIGKELDSLADMLTFGFLPAALIYQMLKMQEVADWVPYLAFIIAVFSALRLAKFNIDTRQTTSFIGVPTPANALFLTSFPAILQYSELPVGFIQESWLLLVCAVVFSFLLVAELPLFALKFKNFSWGDNKLKYIFLLTSVLLIILLKFVAVPLIIILYILVSVFTRKP